MTADLSLRLSRDLEEAFPDLVADFRRAVFTTALRTSGCAEDAADVAAEAFLRAYSALRTYPPERILELQLRPWLLTIVLNLVRNQARTAGRRPAHVALESWTGRDDGAESPEDHAERHDGQARLGRLLTGLPERQRTAVVLRHVVGLPYAELATVMACPEGLRALVSEEAR
jgi:RNA polymerase sigma-70 factor (ECF subfamily)